MTRDKLQAAIKEITDICKKHDIVLVGTCNAEQIRGEITFEAIDEYAPEEKQLNFYDGDWYCGVIG